MDDQQILLYDVAFLAPVLDDEGNATGDLVEAEPVEGLVRVEMTFKNAQMDNVVVEHIKLPEDLVEEKGTTLDAAQDISKDDLTIENLGNTDVNLGEDRISFTTDSFSLIGSYPDENESELDPSVQMTDYSLGNILNNYVMFVLDGSVNGSHVVMMINPEHPGSRACISKENSVRRIRERLVSLTPISR